MQMGQGCSVGEHFLYFNFKSEEPYPVVSNEGSIVSTSSTASQAPSSFNEKATCSRKVIVHELMTVLQLKQQLLDDWDTVLSSGDKGPLPLKPMSPNHIRLRDLKIPGSSGLGTLLRNERVLARCISGISDGRKISLMVTSLPIIVIDMDTEHARRHSLVFLLSKIFMG